MRMSRGQLFGAVGVGLLGIGTLSSCATLGGNVKGDFVCRAPDGICAPTTAIDDQALAQIGREGSEPTDDYTYRPKTLERRGVSAQAPADGRALKIVLPGRVDRFGRQRAPQIVYASLGDFGAEVTGGGRGADRLSLSELAGGAPTYSDLGGPSLARTAAGDPAQMNAAVREAYANGRRGGSATGSDLQRGMQEGSDAAKDLVAASVSDDGPVLSAPSFPAQIEDQ